MKPAILQKPYLGLSFPDNWKPITKVFPILRAVGYRTGLSALPTEYPTAIMIYQALRDTQ